MTGLAILAFEQGDHATAATLHRQSLALLRTLGDRAGIAHSLDGLARVLAADRGALAAARIWGAVERLRAEAGFPRSPVWRSRFDRSVAATRAALDDDAAFSHAWQEGHVLSIEQTIDAALGKT